MDDETVYDTLDSIKGEFENQVIKLEGKIDNIKAGNAKRKKYYAQKKALVESDPFTKTYHKGIDEMKSLKLSGDITFSDIGKFHMISASVQKDTGLIVSHVTGLPMSLSEIADEIGDYKQNIYKTFEKLIAINIIWKKNISGMEVYYVNPEYIFNGASRMAANINIYNNCNIQNNTIVNPVIKL